MNLFETVKNNVSLREAAQAYGLEVNRHGKALAPFTMTDTPACMWQTTIIIALPAESMEMSLTSLQGCLISSPTTQP